MDDERTRPERRLWGGDVARDVRDEIAFHLEERERELTGAGLTAHGAREEALRRFGPVDPVAAVCARIDRGARRQERWSRMWTDLLQDCRYAVRSLARTPAFTLVALATLALGIGANTAMFSIVNAVLLQPLPFRSPDRLVFIWSSTNAFPRAPLTPGRLLDFRERLTSVSEVAGISHLSVNLAGPGDPERIVASSVSSNFFDLLGVPAMLGDPFHAGRADDRDVVLSYGLWVRRFGGDAGIVGRELLINGRPRRVVAVMPRVFEWPSITGTGSSYAGGPELWIPAARHDVPRMPADDPQQDLAGNRRAAYLRAVGRLREGTPIGRAQREAEAIATQLGIEHPVSDGGRGAVVQPMRDQLFGAVRQPLVTLLGAVVFVLAIACANAASLLLGRASARRREIAVRRALGATRGRLVRQLLAESTVLAGGGAALGLLLAWWARTWLVSLAPEGILRLDATRLDATVLAFTAFVAMTTGVVFGLVPAWQASAPDTAGDLSDGGIRGTAGRRTTRARNVLVAIQIAVALVLLVGSGLLLRSFAHLARTDVGFDTRNLLTFDIFLSGTRSATPAASASFYDELLRSLRALPGVDAAGAAVTLPIGGDDFGATFRVEGAPPAEPGREPTAGYQIVTPGYFEAIGMRIEAGRDFGAGDRAGAAPVVIVNQALARHHWPGENPVGRRLRVGAGPDTPWRTVVGVVSDIRHLGPATPPRPEFYEPHTQTPFSFMAFVVRTSGDPRVVLPSVRAAVSRLDPSLPVAGATTMEAHVRRALQRSRFMSVLTSAFGGLALALAVVGLYGLIGYSVTQRRREIAIRSALGARRVDVVRLVLGKAALLAGIGVAAGVAAASLVARLLQGLLHGVTHLDPLTYAAVSALLLGVVLVAAAVPALRAATIDSAAELRG